MDNNEFELGKKSLLFVKEKMQEMWKMGYAKGLTIVDQKEDVYEITLDKGKIKKTQKAF